MLANKVVKDLPVGVLIMVVSMFFAYPLYHFIAPSAPFWAPFATMISIILGYNIYSFGYDLAFRGIETDDEE